MGRSRPWVWRIHWRVIPGCILLGPEGTGYRPVRTSPLSGVRIFYLAIPPSPKIWIKYQGTRYRNQYAYLNSHHLIYQNFRIGAAILITSKAFDPSAYLSAVHPSATYHDLATGIAHLENAIEARAEAVRILVEDHFDRFASVKATIEGMPNYQLVVILGPTIHDSTGLHEDMKSGILVPETEYGSKPLRDHLKREFHHPEIWFLIRQLSVTFQEGGQKANQIYLPVLEGASKARKLRTTLAIFERSRFFFNLPSFIIESIDAVWELSAMSLRFLTSMLTG